MATLKKSLLLTLGAVTLLSACDDGDNGQTWVDRFWRRDAAPEQRQTILASGLRDVLASDSEAGTYLAAQFAQYRQDWPAANRYFDRLMAMDEDNQELQQRAMVLAMQAGDDKRAIDLAQKVLAKDKKNLLALLFVGVDQLAKQDYTGAVKTLERMPSNGVADFIRPILIAWAKSPTGMDEETLLQTGPLHAYHALLIADYRGTVKSPERYFITVLAGGGADRHILESMGDVYARQGQKELAKKIYDTLIADSQDALGSSSRIDALIAKRDGKADLASIPRIKTPEQGAAEAFYNMARILFQDKSDESALVFARLGQHLDPDKQDIRMLLASMMVRGGHTAEAVQLYKSVKPDVPGYKESMRSAADLLEQEGKPDEAVAFLEDHYGRSRDPDFLIQIGDVYRRQEKYDQAIKAYDRAQADMGGKVSSDYWGLLYARGMSHERNGDMKKAEDDLLAALEFQPEHPYLLNYLGYSWADQGKNLPRAMELLNKAASLKPDDGYIVDSLGWAYFKMADYAKATEELEKASELVPYDPTINDHLGDVYWMTDRKAEARFQWQRALNNSEDDKQKDALKKKVEDGLVPPVAKARDKNAASDQKTVTTP